MVPSLLSCLCIGFCALAHGQRSLINDRKFSGKSSGCGQSPSISTGKSTSMSGTFDGTKRTWRVYLPSNYNKNTPCVLFRVISIINLPHIPSNGLANNIFVLLVIQHCARHFNSWLGWQVRCNSFCCFLLFFVFHRCNLYTPAPSASIITAVHKMRVAVVYQQLLQMAGISLPFTPTDTLIIRTGDIGVLGTVSGKRRSKF